MHEKESPPDTPQINKINCCHNKCNQGSTNCLQKAFKTKSTNQKKYTLHCEVLHFTWKYRPDYVLSVLLKYKIIHTSKWQHMIHIWQHFRKVILLKIIYHSECRFQLNYSYSNKRIPAK